MYRTDGRSEGTGLPLPTHDLIRAVFARRRGAFAADWYGLVLTVARAGEVRVEFNTDPDAFDAADSDLDDDRDADALCSAVAAPSV